MPFIGTQPEVGKYSVLDALTASATASYTLQLNSANFSPASANQLLVSLNGVIQKPGSSFTISGSTLTFSSALTSSDSIDFIISMGEPLLIGTPSDATITSAKLANANLEMPNSLDMNGKELILDIDGDTSITADTDDKIDFKIAGSDRGNIHYDGNDFFSLESNDYLTLVQNQTAERGVILGPTYFKPYNANDNQLDLGIGAARWKDLYLSGGAYIGGTGAANKLDDYEEGTWVPVVKDTSGGSAYTYASHYEFRLPGLTSSTNALPYTKIGNRVFITFSIWWNTTANTRYNISLPFAYDGSAYGLCGSATPYNISTDSGLGILGTISNVANFDTYAVTSSGGHGTVPYSSSSEVYYFINYVVA